ncbi:MAG: Rpn family recombination-promoting nuclease/putative transposase [Methylococcaceae bacterium]|nr:Rpn family recombination-promoting nuclease/putative transposase [Methylococcaceae bacterium]
MKFANPTNDIAFKKIFGDSHKKEILISLLNAILGFKNNKTIKDVTIVNPYQVPKIEELKETILDIKATNQDNEHFIVEMQKKDLGNFAKRSLYYTSKAYVQQLEKGSDYSKLKKVYFIGILNFDMFSSENYISRHLILNKETLTADLDDFEFTFLELNKFNKKLNQLDSLLDKWVYFLKNTQDLTLIPTEFKNIKAFDEAFKIATQHTWNKKELDVYDYIALKEYDEINAIKTAEEKAIKKGIEQGRAKEKIKVAEGLLLAGVDMQIIINSTGLTEKEVEQLSINLKKTKLNPPPTLTR